MGGGGGNLMLPLLMPMPLLVYETLDTQILSTVAFRVMYNPVGFDDSKLDAVKGCETEMTAPPYPSPLRLRRK